MGQGRGPQPRAGLPSGIRVRPGCVEDDACPVCSVPSERWRRKGSRGCRRHPIDHVRWLPVKHCSVSLSSPLLSSIVSSSGDGFGSSSKQGLQTRFHLSAWKYGPDGFVGFPRDCSWRMSHPEDPSPRPTPPGFCGAAVPGCRQREPSLPRVLLCPCPLRQSRRGLEIQITFPQEPCGAGNVMAHFEMKSQSQNIAFLWNIPSQLQLKHFTPAFIFVTSTLASTNA